MQLSPIRQRALIRELRRSVDQLAEINRSHDTPITPPYIPLIASIPTANVKVELIPTTRLPLNTTKHTGEIDTMSNITTITQEDDKPTATSTSTQVEEEEDEKEYSQDDVQQIKNQIREKLLEYYNKHNHTFPQTMRISAHNLLPLATAGLIETVFKLRDLPTTVVADPTIGDDIRCCDG